MLITFTSKAAGDVIMFGDVARRLLEIMGKDPADTRGIVTVEQLPGALAALRGAVAEDKAMRVGEEEDDIEPDDDDRDRPRPAPQITLSQRAAPLIELMGYAQRDGEPVMWEGR